MQRERDPPLPADLLVAVGIDQEREGRPIRPAGRLDDPGDEMLLGGRIEVLEVLARRLGVAGEVEVATIVDAL
jgi:hypothetical protein